ncbi:MAG TPA: chemotaxis protein CheW, partial [Hyphomonadaceae bacterium]|nr:chemotaxis protein CheW [Hyphomonadaceae bacterium]
MARQPSSRAEAETQRFMTFRAAGQLYAVPAGDVREIVKTPPLVRVPLGPKALLGLGNLRGSVLPVAGLALLLGRSDTVAGDKSRVIVLEGKSPFGLMVDEVEALVEVSSSQVKAAEAEFSASEGELLKGVFRDEDSSEPVKILDLAGLLARAFGSFTRSAPARSGAAVRQTSREAVASDDRDILIVFEVGGQEFALPIASVIEVLRAPETTTALPHSETAVLGMVGLRDALLPLMSLQALLGLTGKSKGGMVIVAAVGGAIVGLAADGVQEIIRVSRSELEPVPVVIASRTKGETRVQFVIKADGGRRLIAVLSPDQLFREDIMIRIRQQMPTTGPGPQASANASERIFLVFTLGGQEYGLAISAVEEVARLPDQVTRLPRSPDFLKGVINLRG